MYIEKILIKFSLLLLLLLLLLFLLLLLLLLKHIAIKFIIVQKFNSGRYVTDTIYTNYKIIDNFHNRPNLHRLGTKKYTKVQVMLVVMKGTHIAPLSGLNDILMTE